MYDEIPSLTDFQDKWRPWITNKTFRCALCNRTFTRVSGAHLHTHEDFIVPRQGMKRVRKSKQALAAEQEETPNQYVDRWTQRKETVLETYTRLFGATNTLNALIQKTFDLYAPSRSEWTMMEHLQGKAEWTTITPEYTGWPWHSNYLTKDRLKEHFLGLNTVGVKARGSTRAKVIVFDVDAVAQYGESVSDAESRAKQVTRALVRVMLRHKLTPHVIGSGGKGYHIALYFASLVSNATAKHLFDYLVNHPDVPSMNGVRVECLPQQRAVKLPLGIHWSAQKLATYVDPLTLMPVEDPYGYYLRIRPMDKAVLDEFIPEERAGKPHKRNTHMSESWSVQALDIAYKIGIEARGTRHHTTLRAAAYIMFHLKPDTSGALFELLERWSERQYHVNGANIRSPWSEHRRDVERIADYVWSHRLSGGISLTVDFSAGDVHWICDQTPTLSGQKLLFAALYQQRITGGYFYFGVGRMQQLTGLANDSLSTAIHELREHRGLLRVIAKHSHQVGLRKSKTTKYALTCLPEHRVVESHLVTVTERTWEPDFWFRLLQMIYTPVQIRKLYPFAYHRILAAASSHPAVLDLAE